MSNPYEKDDIEDLGISLLSFRCELASQHPRSMYVACNSLGHELPGPNPAFEVGG